MCCSVTLFNKQGRQTSIPLDHKGDRQAVKTMLLPPNGNMKNLGCFRSYWAKQPITFQVMPLLREIINIFKDGWILYQFVGSGKPEIHWASQ